MLFVLTTTEMKHSNQLETVVCQLYFYLFVWSRTLGIIQCAFNGKHRFDWMNNLMCV